MFQEGSQTLLLDPTLPYSPPVSPDLHSPSFPTKITRREHETEDGLDSIVQNFYFTFVENEQSQPVGDIRGN